MPNPELESVIHSLHQDQNLVSEQEDFYEVSGDLWSNSWVKEERIYRVSGSDETRRIPIYSLDELEITSEISSKTPDTLAFYVSFHYSRYKWGIYLLRSGVISLAKYLVDKGLNFSEAVELARRFLLRHELTHFQTDFGITTLELTIKTPLYLKFRKDSRLLSPGWNTTEEGLANRLARSDGGKQGRLMDDFLNSSPQGYRDWNTHKAKNEACCWSNVLDLRSSLSASSDTRLLAFSSMTVARRYFLDVPIYEVVDLPGTKPADYFLGPISNIRETKEFKDDLEKLAKGQPSYRKKWVKTKEKLQGGNLVGGTHLEKLKGTKSPIYSIGLDSEARVALHRGTVWEAIAADHHDPLYSRLKRRFGV